MTFGVYKQDLQRDEFYKEYNRIQAKIDSGQDLTDEEKRFFSSAAPFDKLLLYPFCLDEYYCRIYLNITIQPISQKDIRYYKGILNEWKKIIDFKNHSEELLHFIAKETREELKTLKKKYSFLLLTSSLKDYLNKRNKIFEWAKYKYITIKHIFNETIKANEYKLYLNGQEIVYNYFSLSHILTGHYGHIMKPYEASESHFTDMEFDPELLHLKIKNIFERIDSSNLYTKDSVEEINFKYKNIIYKIYCKYETPFHQKGKGAAVQFLRLNSFFPVTGKKMLGRLETEFIEKKIDQDLSVFVTIGS